MAERPAEHVERAMHRAAEGTVVSRLRLPRAELRDRRGPDEDLLADAQRGTRLLARRMGHLALVDRTEWLTIRAIGDVDEAIRSR